MWCCCRNSKFCDAMLWHDSWDLEGSWFTSLLNPGKCQGQPRCLRQQQVLTSTREVSFHLQQQQSGCFLWEETKTVSDTREENWDLRKLYQCFASPPCGLGPHPPGSTALSVQKHWYYGEDGPQVEAQCKALWSDMFGVRLWLLQTILWIPLATPCSSDIRAPDLQKKEMVTDEETNYQGMSMHK